ncbi:MAG: AMP-binding protein, partial [Candidatus Dormibacteria bacterium]
ALVRLLVEERITVWYSVPGALVALLDASNTELLDQAALRVVLYAGEVFPARRLRELITRLPAAEVHNLYGPTETNVCTAHRLRDRDIAAAEVPIGRLCDFAAGHVIDDLGRRAELTPGARCELVIGGASVMLGYWGGSAAATPGANGSAAGAAPGERLHATGDLVHVNRDGELVFDGRRDDMVKIRGYRVEPAEVEAAILASPEVGEACVVAVADDHGVCRLEAYIVAGGGGEVDVSAVLRTCSQRLPRYMLPERICSIPELPRGSTGKVDRRALVARSQVAAGVGGNGQ